MKPAEAVVTQEDVELAERLRDGVNARIEVLLSELRGLLRQARITPETIAQRAVFAKLEAARIASTPSLDSFINGVAEAARKGEIRSPDHPEERALDEAFMAWQVNTLGGRRVVDHEWADGVCIACGWDRRAETDGGNGEPAGSCTAHVARMQRLVDGELAARETIAELHGERQVDAERIHAELEAQEGE